MNSLRLSARLVALFLATAALLPAAAIDGRWTAEFDTQVGHQKYLFDFVAADGEKLTGTATWERMGQKGKTPLTDGRFAGDAVAFTELVDADGMTLRIAYEGKLQGDELKLTRTVGDFAVEQIVAKRAATPAAASSTPAAPAPFTALVPDANAPYVPSGRAIASGPFQPTWQSLAEHYRAPEWFRDAKFGIWAHWSAQCVPEQGDWYARHMYIQDHRQYEHHLKTYGHPSKVGFLEMENRWKAERWDPEKLMQLYRRAGAKYFVALANHHDNFDAYDSKHHAWNSVRIGSKKDIVGTWAKIARAHGLKFGVSNHSAHAWHWYQTAYGYDAEGPHAGVRYDAFTLKKEDGKGTWWEGLDPQDLYTGPNMVIPDGLTTLKAHADWHEQNDRKWDERPPAMNPQFVDKWFLRTQDLMDSYRPDLVYFDNFALPLGQAGLDIAAHFYNASLGWHDGQPNAVINVKGVSPERRGAVIDDIERGVAEGIRPAPWQTDTCIGDWHYNRDVYDRDRYKTVAQVVRMLVDIVSKNGNLLLSVPVRGDGTLDEKEIAFLEGMAKWMDVNGEAIFGTRPWNIFGEGPSADEKPEAGHFGGARDVRSKPYTAEDIRFTTKGGTLYAFVMDWPANGSVLVKSLGDRSPHFKGREIINVSLLGHDGELEWTQERPGLRVKLPATPPSEHAVVLKITAL
ncbi:MAG TPA: alpha-L-fucosidase [Opitutus sp.]|nr:alpha-L-fucosidase [Opitutus sp.]